MGAPAASARAGRILHLLAPARYGGLERVVATLAAHHRAAGRDVRVCPVLTGAASEDHPFLASLSAAGVPVETLRLGARSYRREISAVRELVRRLAPVIVHTHGYRSDVVDGRFAARPLAPIVSTVHGFTGGGFRNRVYEWAQRRALRRFDAVVAVSAPLRRSLAAEGVPDERLHLVPNAWDGRPPLPRGEARSRLGLTDGIFHVGWLGRISHEKGPDTLVEALARLGMDPGWQATVIGDGPLRAGLEERCGRAGLRERVRWVGEVQDAGGLLSAFDAFVLSSRTEGTPIVLLEAMAARCPAVVTAVGGVPDVVSPREALLVPPDDPEALARALLQIRADPTSAARRSAAAADRLGTDFATEGWVRRYEEVYARISSRPRSR